MPLAVAAAAAEGRCFERLVVVQEPAGAMAEEASGCLGAILHPLVLAVAVAADAHDAVGVACHLEAALPAHDHVAVAIGLVARLLADGLVATMGVELVETVLENVFGEVVMGMIVHVTGTW